MQDMINIFSEIHKFLGLKINVQELKRSLTTDYLLIRKGLNVLIDDEVNEQVE